MSNAGGKWPNTPYKKPYGQYTPYARDQGPPQDRQQLDTAAILAALGVPAPPPPVSPAMAAALAGLKKDILDEIKGELAAVVEHLTEVIDLALSEETDEDAASEADEPAAAFTQPSSPASPRPTLKRRKSVAFIDDEAVE